MSISQEINEFLSEFGVPATAIALAVGLIRGAKAFETGANPNALKYVATLLTSGGMTNIGKAGVAIVPVIFQRIFGTKATGLKFILRSIITTSFFWFILLLTRHSNLQFVCNCSPGVAAWR
jgi:hypothetical protein